MRRWKRYRDHGALALCIPKYRGRLITIERKLKVGLAGVGGLDRGSRYGVLFNGHPRTEVTAICDLDKQALNHTKTALGLKSSQCFQDYDDFVKADFDIVFIGTPMDVHAQEAIVAHTSTAKGHYNSSLSDDQLYWEIRSGPLKDSREFLEP